MKIKLLKEIEIPENVEVKIDGNLVKVKGPEGENSREFDFGKVNVEVKDKKIILECESGTRREKKTMNTSESHIKNMVKGVQEKFKYTLKICFSHFPFTVKLEGNQAIIKNFLGEKVNRTLRIMEGAEVKLDKEIITITSVDKEIAGQTAANFETATKIRGRDIRIFQDGVYIVDKAGRIM